MTGDDALASSACSSAGRRPRKLTSLAMISQTPCSLPTSSWNDPVLQPPFDVELIALLDVLAHCLGQAIPADDGAELAARVAARQARYSFPTLTDIHVPFQSVNPVFAGGSSSCRGCFRQRIPSGSVGSYPSSRHVRLFGVARRFPFLDQRLQQRCALVRCGIRVDEPLHHLIRITIRVR